MSKDCKHNSFDRINGIAKPNTNNYLNENDYKDGIWPELLHFIEYITVQSSTPHSYSIEEYLWKFGLLDFGFNNFI